MESANVLSSAQSDEAMLPSNNNNPTAVTLGISSFASETASSRDQEDAMPRSTKIIKSRDEETAPNTSGILEPILEMMPRSDAPPNNMLRGENTNGGVYRDAKRNCDLPTVCLKRDQSEDVRTFLKEVFDAMKHGPESSLLSYPPDFNLMIQNKCINVHALVLSIASPLLREVLRVDCSCQRKDQKLKLDDCNESQINQILQTIYTGSCTAGKSEVDSIVKSLKELGIVNVTKQVVKNQENGKIVSPPKQPSQMKSSFLIDNMIAIHTQNFKDEAMDTSEYNIQEPMQNNDGASADGGKKVADASIKLDPQTNTTAQHPAEEIQDDFTRPTQGLYPPSAFAPYPHNHHSVPSHNEEPLPPSKSNQQHIATTSATSASLYAASGSSATSASLYAASGAPGSGGNVDFTDGGRFAYPHPPPAPAPSPAVPNHALAPTLSHAASYPPSGAAFPQHSLVDPPAPHHPTAPTPLPHHPQAPTPSPAAPQHSIAPTPGPLASHPLAHLPHHSQYSGHHYPSTSAMAAYQSHMMSQMTWYQHMMAAAAVSQNHHPQTFQPRILCGAKQEPADYNSANFYGAKRELANPSSFYALKEGLGAAGLFDVYKGAAATSGGHFGAGLYEEQPQQATVQEEFHQLGADDISNRNNESVGDVNENMAKSLESNASSEIEITALDSDRDKNKDDVHLSIAQDIEDDMAGQVVRKLKEPALLSAIQNVECSECNARFPTEDQLIQHLDLSHKRDKYPKRESVATAMSLDTSAVKKSKQGNPLSDISNTRKKEGVLLDCCDRNLDVRSFFLHCVRVHARTEMAVNYEQIFKEKGGACFKCGIKYRDILSYCDHLGVQHRLVIDFIIDQPRFATQKEQLQKLKAEQDANEEAKQNALLEIGAKSVGENGGKSGAGNGGKPVGGGNGAKDVSQDSDIEVLQTPTSKKTKKCPMPRCVRAESSNSLLLRHIVDMHYYTQLRTKLQTNYKKKRYCDCPSVDNTTLRLFVRHHAIHHEGLLEFCTPAVKNIINNARFHKKRRSKTLETTPKTEIAAASGQNSKTCAVSVTAVTASTTPSSTTRNTREKFVLCSEPRTRQQSAGVDTRTRKSAMAAASTAMSQPTGRPRKQSENVTTPSRSEEKKEKAALRTSVGGAVRGRAKTPTNPSLKGTPKSADQSVRNKTKSAVQAVRQADSPKTVGSPKGSYFWCKLCSATKQGYKTFLSHLSANHYREEIRRDYGDPPSAPKLKPCPICNQNISETNYFNHVGSKHMAVLRYADWFQGKPSKGGEAGEVDADQTKATPEGALEAEVANPIADSGEIDNEVEDPDYRLGD